MKVDVTINLVEKLISAIVGSEKIFVKYFKESDKVQLSWTSIKNAYYKVCVCRANDWASCNGELDCFLLPNNVTQYTGVMGNVTSYVFGVSTCYKNDECSPMKFASTSNLTSI